MLNGFRLVAAALFAAALFSFAPEPAVAEGDVERGGVLAYTCLGCHGIEGYRNAYPSYRVPKLGGQTPEYIVIALRAYRDGNRPHETMQAQAKTLSDQDMEDLAAFFASYGGPREGGLVTGGPAARGAQKVATCTACHGENGIGLGPEWPTIGGQHESYLLQSLREYQSQIRNNAVMYGLVSALSEQDLKDLAAYYAAQPGLFTTKER